MLVTDVAVSSSHDRKPSMSCILYPMMNFSPQHWQTVYIFKTKFVVDLVYLYRTNFQNVDTAVVSNNTTDTCSPPPQSYPHGGLIHHSDSHFDLQLLVSILQYRGLSPDVTTRRAVLILNEWVLQEFFREGRVVEGAHFVYYTEWEKYWLSVGAGRGVITWLWRCSFSLMFHTDKLKKKVLLIHKLNKYLSKHK